MKHSLYNTLIPLANGNALLYNALSDRSWPSARG